MRTLITAVAAAVFCLLTTAQPSGAGKEPRNKNYFTTFLGLEAPFEISADCLDFTASELCTLDEACGEWERSGEPGKQGAFTFEIDGSELQADGRARVDSRGRGSAMGGTGWRSAGGLKGNFAMAGQALSRRQCARLVEEFDVALGRLERAVDAAEGALPASASGDRPWNPAAKNLPGGKTYFTIFVGFGDRLDFGADCLRFSAQEICPSGGLCGQWGTLERERKLAGFELQIADETGRTVDAVGRLDNRGKASSIAGAGYVRNPVKAGNFAFAGRATSPGRCARLIAAIEGDWNNVACVRAADFGDPAESDYVLPYPVGDAYRLSQSYCDALGGHHSHFAYDFAMPIGSPVVAARDGTVTSIQDGTLDGDYTPGAANKVFIEHDDGSLAFYAHFQNGSVLVAAGDRVTAGQQIASSGDSGNTGGLPHLHFEVFGTAEREASNTLPVNFSNAAGALDDRGGLIPGETYEALAN